MNSSANILGVVLAGGLSRRMGSPTPKGLIEFRGKAMVSHVIERLAPQVSSLVLNANSHQDDFARLNLPIVQDNIAGFVGPLAGVHAAMKALPSFEWYLMCPCDSPFLPENLAQALLAAAQAKPSKIASVRCQDQDHPVFALIHRDMLTSLEAFLTQGGRKLDRWYAQEHYALAQFSDPLAFLNFNTPEEMAAYQG